MDRATWSPFQFLSQTSSSSDRQKLWFYLWRICSDLFRVINMISRPSMIKKRKYLRCWLQRRIMFSKKVFCGATRPRLPPGIVTLMVLIFETVGESSGGEMIQKWPEPSCCPRQRQHCYLDSIFLNPAQKGSKNAELWAAIVALRKLLTLMSSPGHGRCLFPCQWLCFWLRARRLKQPLRWIISPFILMKISILKKKKKNIITPSPSLTRRPNLWK